MARMGQATLPLKGAVTCNPSDSEETEVFLLFYAVELEVYYWVSWVL